MRSRTYLLLAAALLLLSSHDMFLKPASYFLASGVDVEIALFNGTFAESENTIDRSRMSDVSIVGGGQRVTVDTTQWSERGEETVLRLATGAPGTYVAGVSTRARSIDMAADAFNDYLRHEGGVDMLAEREAGGVMDEAATERYSKHVKTVFQVGDARTDDYATVLDYPIEFVPLSNPYTLHPGDGVEVRLLRDGRPLPNQVVLVGHEAAAHTHDGGAAHTHDGGEAHTHDGGEAHTHDGGEAHTHDGGEAHTHDGGDGAGHTHDTGAQLRTDGNGVLTVPVAAAGVYHLRTIHLVTVDEPGLTHESNWATLTFEVGPDAHEHEHDGQAHSHAHGHASDSHTHDHDHHDGGLPGYVWWLGSLAVVGALFFYFNSRR